MPSTGKRKRMGTIGSLGMLAILLAVVVTRWILTGNVDGAHSVADEDGAQVRIATESIFDSSEHPEFAEMLVVTAGLFLPDSGLVVVNRTEIRVVDLASGDTRVVGREGEGPEEFRGITRAIRAHRGIAVWDEQRRRVAFIAPDGGFLHSRDYLDVPFKGFTNVRPVAVHPDGSVVFRDGIRRMVREFAGRIRHPTQFVAVRRDGGVEVVAEAPGDELYYSDDKSDAVIFGHRTMTAATRDRFIVAETGRRAIAVLDWNGREVASISMPAGVKPSVDHVRMARQSAAGKWQRRKGQMMELVASGRTPFSPGAEDWEVFSFPPDWPTNEMAPPVDAILTDFDARLWVRDYLLPGQDSVTWRVWDIDGPKVLFTVRLDAADRLLDARADLVLLRQLDEFDVPRAVVSRLRGEPDPVQIGARQTDTRVK